MIFTQDKSVFYSQNHFFYEKEIAALGFEVLGFGYLLKPRGRKSVINRILSAFELLYWIGGKGWIQVGTNKPCVVQAGSLCLLAPGIRHSYASDKDDYLEEFWLRFCGPSAPSLIPKAFMQN